MATSIQTPVGNAPVIPVVILGAGFYIAWFAIHYWSDSKTKYPTDPVKNVLTGKPLPLSAKDPTAAQVAQNVEAQAQANDANAPGSTATGAAATGIHTTPTGTAAANQAKAQLVAAAYGWSTGTEWNDLVQLWTRESSWDNNATNPGSGAYGIAQALGHGKGAATQGSVTNQYGGYGVADSLAQAANSGDATAQITWGLQYIKLQPGLGSPSAAWAHETSQGWY